MHTSERASAEATTGVTTGGQAPLVGAEPDPIPVWRPTRDKPDGR